MPKFTVNWLTTERHRDAYNTTIGPCCSPDPFECWLLSKLAQDAPNVILEVGTWRGRSASFLGMDLQPNTRLICVDHFKGDMTGGGGADEAAARETVGRLAPRAEIVNADAMTADWGQILPGPVDLMFYDAEHSYRATVDVIQAVYPHLAPDARVVVHDAHFPAVVSAIRTLTDSGRFRHVVTIDIWEGLAILQKNESSVEKK